MKTLISFLILGASFAAHSSPSLTKDDLAGKWLIVMSGGISPQEFELGDDYWIFKKDQFQVETSGKALSPDPYKLDGSKIVYGTKPYEVTIDVISISESKLEVKTGATVQILEKVE